MGARRASSALIVVATSIVVMACRGGSGLDAANPAEVVTVECPTTDDRSCRVSADCGPGAHCTGARCYGNQAGCPCSDVDDCGDKAHCTRGQCYANQAGSPCSGPNQCGSRAHCTVDTCYANASGSPCSESSDCGAHSACVSGKCN